MRKILTFTFIFMGTVTVVLIFSILLYAFVPEFRSTARSLVADKDIPVVTVTPEPELEVQEDINLDKVEEKKPDSYYKITYINNEPVAMDDKPKEAEKLIIDRQYHEDCGTGKGYWVLTYEDGTIEIE